MHLYLIRHGQSFVNLPDWDGGNIDAGLTELGQKQAQALGHWLPTHLPEIDVIYCSTMKRARETAVPLTNAYQLEPIYDDRIREIGNNQLDHKPWPPDVLPDYADFWGSERPFTPISKHPMGESMMHFRTRVGMFLEETVEKHPTGNVVVVCHGGVIEIMGDHVFNIGPWKRCEVWTRNTGVTHLHHVNHPTREIWRLYYQNRTEHLIGLDESGYKRG